MESPLGIPQLIELLESQQLVKPALTQEPAMSNIIAESKQVLCMLKPPFPILSDLWLISVTYSCSLFYTF